MNLRELLDNNRGLVQDGFVGKTFGKKRQLLVIGWSKKKGTNKMYILHCSECYKDPQLWGEGYFANTKAFLEKGLIPCGCAKTIRYTEEQWRIRVVRKLTQLPVKHKFLGWVGEYKGSSKKTLLKLECPTHGVWETTTIDRLTNYSATCKECANDALSERASKDESDIIDSFFASGSFSDGSIFCRSEKLSARGWKLYWKMYCPDCGTTSEAQIGAYQLGFKSCNCSRNRAVYSYLNVITDDRVPVALKFGVCNNLPKRRLAQQRRLSIYTVDNYAMWKFNNKDDCISAENECYLLGGAILTKEEFPDGYTETTSVVNFDKILQIFDKYNGKIVYRGGYNDLSQYNALAALPIDTDLLSVGTCLDLARPF